MKKIIISAFTNDQPGIVSKISGKVSSLNGNIIIFFISIFSI